MNIYERIEKDHLRHRELLDQIAETSGDSAERRGLWREFYNDVKAHAAAEEETFYAALMVETWGQDKARHSVSEHKELDEIIDELQDMDFSSSGWLNRFKTLHHEYVHHIDEEEDEVFERAREVIDGGKAAELGPKFDKRKQRELELVDEKSKDKLED
ncbi:MAG: hemerythrin domain-containing protein [Beijerinckiaceae bacterium]